MMIYWRKKDKEITE